MRLWGRAGSGGQTHAKGCARYSGWTGTISRSPALKTLADDGEIEQTKVAAAIARYGFDTEAVSVALP